jgi:hypothetical protein
LMHWSVPRPRRSSVRGARARTLSRHGNRSATYGERQWAAAGSSVARRVKMELMLDGAGITRSTTTAVTSARCP